MPGKEKREGGKGFRLPGKKGHDSMVALRFYRFQGQVWGSGVGEGGVEGQREVRGSQGTGNNEEEGLVHFLGLPFGL